MGELIKYIRDGKDNHKKGVIISLSSGSVGFSLCNEKAGDIFSRDRGMSIARGRAEKNPIVLSFWELHRRYVPHSILDDVYKMLLRSESYFK